MSKKQNTVKKYLIPFTARKAIVKANEAVEKATKIIGYQAYLNTHPYNNGIRAVNEFMFLVIILYHFTGSRTQYFCNKKPSYFGIEDCKNEAKAIPDAIAFNKSTGDRSLVEFIGGIHNTIGTTLSYLAMGKKEIHSSVYKAEEHNADRIFIIVDKCMQEEHNYLQKEADKVHKDISIINATINAADLIRPTFNMGSSEINKVVSEYTNMVNNLVQEIIDPEVIISKKEVLDVIYAVASFARGNDLTELFLNNGLDAKSLMSLSKDTGINQALLHLFFEDEVIARLQRNKATAKSYLSHSAAKAMIAAKSTKKGRKLTSVL